METIDLGLVKAIEVGTTAPSNTNMLWYDDNTGVKLHKYYDTVTSSWKTLLSGVALTINITFLDLKTLKDASSLLRGVTYCITDRYNYQSDGTDTPNPTFYGDDRGLIYIQALETNILSKQVVRIMACPSSYTTGLSVGNYWKGIWYSSMSAPGGGELTIWGGRVWVSTSSSVGTAPDDFTLSLPDWDLVNKSSDIDGRYIDKQFSAIYDFDNDWIEQQWDGNGNRVGVNFSDAVNYHGILYNPCDITDWNMTAERKTISSFYENNQPLGIYNNLSPYILTNKSLRDGSYIKNNTTTGNISNNLDSIYNNTNTGNINNNTLIIYNLGGTITNCNYNQVENISGPGSLPSRYQIDIDGLTTLNLASHYPQYNREMYLKSTNITESIDTISNFPSLDTTTGKNQIVRFYVYPSFELTLVSGSGADNPHCEGGLSAVLNGVNGDWIEFQRIVRNGVGSKALSQINIGTY